LRAFRDREAEEALRKIVEALGMQHLNPESIRVVRSDSRSSAYARIWGVNAALQAGLGVGPTYVVELIEGNFSRLSCVEAIETIIHELAHIPRTFSGNLRPHNKYFRRDLRAWVRKLRRDSNLLKALEAEACPKLLKRA